MTARTLCDFWTVGAKELNGLLDADKNSAGDLSEWEQLRDQMQEGVFTDDRAEALCHSEVQKALDRGHAELERLLNKRPPADGQQAVLEHTIKEFETNKFSE